MVENCVHSFSNCDANYDVANFGLSFCIELAEQNGVVAFFTNIVFLDRNGFLLLTGVKIFDKCEIQRVLTKNKQVRGVVTAQRMVECKYFVNCAGMVIFV